MPRMPRTPSPCRCSNRPARYPIDEGRFLATNVPDYARLLRERADALYEPELRAYKQLAPAIAMMAGAVA